MRSGIIILLLCILFPIATFSQAVGYQGKKFIIEAGVLPLTNLVAHYFDYTLADDQYLDQTEPILFKVEPRVAIEYVIFNSGSLKLKYNPFKVQTNIAYWDMATDVHDYVAAETKGNMYSITYQSYYTPTAAPLGNYFGFSAIIYKTQSSIIESDLSEVPLPDEIASYTLPDKTFFGLSISDGIQTIFWDKMVLDIALEAGYFFGDDAGDLSTTEGIDDRYLLESDESPVYRNLHNTRAYFFVAPAINIGFLAF